jgi:hypothetical protein
MRRRKIRKTYDYSSEAPNVLTATLDGIDEHINELSDFVDTCRRAVRLPDEIAEFQRIFKQGLGVAVKKSKLQRLRSAAKKVADLGEEVKPLVDAEFGYLFELAIVRLWTALEAAMNAFCLALLGHEERWKSLDAVNQVKLTLGEFMQMSEGDQLKLVFETMLSTTRARHAPGIGRWETFLKSLELGGDVPEGIRKTLLWLGETRHILVHRHGIVDDKYLKTCAWAGTPKGERVRINGSAFFMSRNAVKGYIDVIGVRLEAAGLAPVRPNRQAYVGKTVSRLVQQKATTTDTYLRGREDVVHERLQEYHKRQQTTR